MPPAACGGTYRGTRVGKEGWMTVFSLHTRKHMTTLGEGGMITTDDPAVNERTLRHPSVWKHYRQLGDQL